MAGEHLDIAIVGAGLGGLAAALFLRKQHHAVTVYERNAGLSEVGAGIQIPPNASRLLARLGVLESLEAAATQPKTVQLRRYADSEILQVMPTTPDMKQTFGHPYLLIRRAEYQRILYAAAVSAGVRVLFESDVAGIDQDVPALVLNGSRQIRCDLIIGADGVNSCTRRCILDPSTSGAIVSHLRAYRAIVAHEAIMQDPVGRSFMQSSSQNIWVGPDRHMVVYPMGDQQACNLVMVHPGHADASAQTWNQKGSIAEMAEAYRDFGPEVQALLSLVRDVGTWKLMEVPTLETWSSRNRRVVLIGDAAHAMLPCAAQGAAQAVEDGAVLAACLSYVSRGVSIERCVDVYTQLRKPRAERVASVAGRNADTWHMHDGVEQESRDRAWKETQDVLLQAASSDGGTRSMAKDRLPTTEYSQWMYGSDVVGEVAVAMRAMTDLRAHRPRLA